MSAARPALSPELFSPVALGPQLEAFITKNGVAVHDEVGGSVYEDYIFVEGESGAFNRAVIEYLGGRVEVDEAGYDQVWVSCPDRLAAFALRRGCPLQFETDSSATDGYIGGEKYGAIVELGRDPVGVHSYSVFRHDTVPTDHMGTVAVFGSALFGLYKGRYSDLIDLADLHDLFTGAGGGMGDAFTQLLAEENEGQFNRIVDETLPHLLDRNLGPAAHNPELSLEIRHLASVGLDRLGVEHPNILRPSDHACGTCYYHNVHLPRAARRALARQEAQLA